MTRDINDPNQFSVVHGDLEKGNADVVIKFPANSISPHHWHTTAERMVLLSGELHLTYVGHETMILNPGSYAYGPAKPAHTALCTRSEESRVGNECVRTCRSRCQPYHAQNTMATRLKI